MSLIGAGAIGLGAGVVSGRLNRRNEISDREHHEQREDTAIQRRVQDSVKAGVNPLASMQGGAQASQTDDSSDLFRDALNVIALVSMASRGRRGGSRRR